NRHRDAARDELAQAIWEDEPPPASAQAVRTLLSKLRSTFGRDILAVDGPLRLSLPTDVGIDVETATRAIHDAESAVERQQWERAWIASHVAMNVARRTFLAGHENPWVDDRRRALEATYTRALAALAAASLRLGETELVTAERAAREFVAAEPLSERA